MHDQGRCFSAEEHLQDHEEERRNPLQAFAEVNVCQKSQAGQKRDRHWTSVTDPVSAIVFRDTRELKPVIAALVL